jgi:hypothetical protein
VSDGSSNSSSDDVEHTKFLNELEIGDAFDYYHEGTWEIAILERFTEYRTEIEINIGESK